MLEVICQVAERYCVTWKLKKTHFFDNKIEFVGVDVSVHGNQPASSKATVLQTWKQPATVRDIASFLGFVGFYARWIPNFELKDFPDLTSTPCTYRQMLYRAFGTHFMNGFKTKFAAPFNNSIQIHLIITSNDKRTKIRMSALLITTFLF